MQTARATKAKAATAAKATSKTAQASGLSAAQRKQLALSNPQMADVLARAPKLNAFFEKQSVASAPDKPTDVTYAEWDIWNHSTGTNAHYSHGMKTESLVDDFIVAMQPSKTKGAVVSLGYREFKGYEIVGVYRLGDQVKAEYRGTAQDGGMLGKMRLALSGDKGTSAVVAWATVSINDDGTVAGGGYPTQDGGGKPVPYQKSGGGAGGGGEYHGRAATIEFGKSNYVPIINDDGDTAKLEAKYWAPGARPK